MDFAIIPARGGSKRIPRKNVRDFSGRPMIAWPIATAIDSGLFAHVVVSTDNEEIAEAARQAGAETPFVRPNDLADDHSDTTQVIRHALAWAETAGWAVERACCLYPTAAFITAEDLAEAGRLLTPDCDFALAAVRYGHPPQRGFVRGADGDPVLVQPEHEGTRTQDLPTVFHDAGQFYWGKREAWHQVRPFFGPRTRFIELPPWRAQDIDRPEDWAMAEKLFDATRPRG